MGLDGTRGEHYYDDDKPAITYSGADPSISRDLQACHKTTLKEITVYDYFAESIYQMVGKSGTSQSKISKTVSSLHQMVKKEQTQLDPQLKECIDFLTVMSQFIDIQQQLESEAKLGNLKDVEQVIDSTIVETANALDKSRAIISGAVSSRERTCLVERAEQDYTKNACLLNRKGGEKGVYELLADAKKKVKDALSSSPAIKNLMNDDKYKSFNVKNFVMAFIAAVANIFRGSSDKKDQSFWEKCKTYTGQSKGYYNAASSLFGKNNFDQTLEKEKQSRPKNQDTNSVSRKSSPLRRY